MTGWPRPRLPRPTARLRLTVLYGSMFTLAGAALLGFTYWLFERGTAGRRVMLVPPRPVQFGAGQHDDVFCDPRHMTAVCQAIQQRQNLDLHALLAGSGIALAVMAALAFALGLLIAGRVLRPVRAITTAARRISATSLHERLAGHLVGREHRSRHPVRDIDRLFQPFQRAGGRTGNGDGHGLGLSIVAAIATAHGAALATRAQPQGGLDIRVSFPATTHPASGKSS